MTKRTKHSLGTRTLRGMFWSYGSYIGTRGSSLLATAVLTRIISPKDFGLVALAGTFMTFLDVLQGLNVGNALIVVKEEDVEDHAETAFAVSVSGGLVLSILTVALTPAAVALFHQPRLQTVMPVLGLTFFFYGLGATHYALASKRMDFRSRTMAELADALARGGVGVVLALSGAGVWALVIGYSAGNIAMDLVLFKLVPWRPRWRPRRRHLRPLLTFGGATTAVGIMAAFLGEFDNIVVGRVLGVTQLGYYSIATKLPYLFIISLAMVAGEVLFPAFSTLEHAELKRPFLTALRYTGMVALPLTATFAVLARPITIGVFGPRWQPAVAASQVLCLWALMSPISMVCGNAFKSRGRADIVLWLAIPQAIAIVVGSLLLVRQGIVAISWVQAAIAVIAQVVTIYIAKRMFALTWGSLGRALAPPLVASAGLAAVMLLVEHAIAAPWPAVVTGGVAGTIVYLGLLHLAAPDMLQRLRAMAFPGAVRPEEVHERESAIAAHEPDAMVRPSTVATPEPGEFPMPSLALAPCASVLMPAFNADATILDAVRSALAQTVGDIEVIVVDDGSRAPAAELLSDVHDDRLRVIRCEMNRGVSHARNLGLSAARAPLVAQLDADDLWRERHLERMLGCFEDPAIGLAYSNVEVVGSPRYERAVSIASESGWLPNRAVHPVNDLPLLYQMNPIPAPSVVMRTRAVREAGGYPRWLTVGEEYYLYIKIRRAGWRFAYVDQAEAIYRWPDSTRGASYSAGRRARQGVKLFGFLLLGDPRDRTLRARLMRELGNFVETHVPGALPVARRVRRLQRRLSHPRSR